MYQPFDVRKTGINTRENDPLLTACLHGDHRAWATFVDRYAPVILAAVNRVLRGRASNTGQAQDIVQDVFVRLIRNDFHALRTFDPDRASLATYLAVVADSTTRDSVRRKRLITASLTDDDATAAAADPPVEQLSIPPRLLSPRQALVVKLLFDRQLTPEAAAATLGITAQSVRSTKHKALSKLRNYFESDKQA